MPPPLLSLSIRGKFLQVAVAFAFGPAQKTPDRFCRGEICAAPDPTHIRPLLPCNPIQGLRVSPTNTHATHPPRCHPPSILLIRRNTDRNRKGHDHQGARHTLLLGPGGLLRFRKRL